jgi:hypothetical protein
MHFTGSIGTLVGLTSRMARCHFDCRGRMIMRRVSKPSLLLRSNEWGEHASTGRRATGLLKTKCTRNLGPTCWEYTRGERAHHPCEDALSGQRWVHQRCVDIPTMPAPFSQVRFGPAPPAVPAPSPFRASAICRRPPNRADCRWPHLRQWRAPTAPIGIAYAARGKAFSVRG